MHSFGLVPFGCQPETFFVFGKAELTQVTMLSSSSSPLLAAAVQIAFHSCLIGTAESANGTRRKLPRKIHNHSCRPTHMHLHCTVTLVLSHSSRHRHPIKAQSICQTVDLPTLTLPISFKTRPRSVSVYITHHHPIPFGHHTRSIPIGRRLACLSTILPNTPTISLNAAYPAKRAQPCISSSSLTHYTRSSSSAPLA